MRLNHLYLLLLLVGGLCPFVLGQEKEQKPIDYKINVESIDWKEGIVLVALELKNVGDQSFVMDKTGILSRVEFFKERVRLANGGLSNGMASVRIGHSGPPYLGDYQWLKPGDSYRATRKLCVSDDFFEPGRSYSLRVSYGHFFEAEYSGLSVWRGTVKSNVVNLGFLRNEESTKNTVDSALRPKWCD